MSAKEKKKRGGERGKEGGILDGGRSAGSIPTLCFVCFIHVLGGGTGAEGEKGRRERKKRRGRRRQVLTTSSHCS